MMNASVLMMGAVLGSAPEFRAPGPERARALCALRSHAKPGLSLPPFTPTTHSNRSLRSFRRTVQTRLLTPRGATNRTHISISVAILSIS
jgi:hypothetical protein